MSANNASNNYTVGESVMANGSSSNSGTVAYWDRSELKLQLTDLKGYFSNNAVIRGNTSGATFSVSTTWDELTDPQEREMYDNQLIQIEANTVVVTTEINPFGLPS